MDCYVRGVIYHTKFSIWYQMREKGYKRTGEWKWNLVNKKVSITLTFLISVAISTTTINIILLVTHCIFVVPVRENVHCICVCVYVFMCACVHEGACVSVYMRSIHLSPLTCTRTRTTRTRTHAHIRRRTNTHAQTHSHTRLHTLANATQIRTQVFISRYFSERGGDCISACSSSVYMHTGSKVWESTHLKPNTATVSSK